MLRAALPVLIAVLSFPVAARAQPGAPDPGPPPEAGPPPADPGAEPSGEDAMCWRGHCGPDRPRRFAVGIAGGHIDFEDAGEGHQHAVVGHQGSKPPEGADVDGESLQVASIDAY